MEELKLIQKAGMGDREAFCSLYELYRQRLYKYAYYRLGNPEDAEDAVSECVLSAWRQISGLKKPEAFQGWIYKILSANCGKMIREKIAGREREEKLQAACAEQAGNPGSTGEWSESSEQLNTVSVELKEALGHLAEDEQEVVLLTVVAGLTSREAGRICGMTPGGVRSKQSRALKKMREYLEA
jgi:RNA polymerase sigma-70 factor (ECF subfamily)